MNSKIKYANALDKSIAKREKAIERLNVNHHKMIERRRELIAKLKTKTKDLRKAGERADKAAAKPTKSKTPKPAKKLVLRIAKSA